MEKKRRSVFLFQWNVRIYTNGHHGHFPFSFPWQWNAVSLTGNLTNCVLYWWTYTFIAFNCVCHTRVDFCIACFGESCVPLFLCFTSFRYLISPCLGATSWWHLTVSVYFFCRRPCVTFQKSGAGGRTRKHTAEHPEVTPGGPTQRQRSPVSRSRCHRCCVGKVMIAGRWQCLRAFYCALWPRVHYVIWDLCTTVLCHAWTTVNT